MFPALRRVRCCVPIASIEILPEVLVIPIPSTFLARNGTLACCPHFLAISQTAASTVWLQRSDHRKDQNAPDGVVFPAAADKTGERENL